MCKRKREIEEGERGSLGYRSAAMTVRSSRRRHRGAVISSSASGHITFTLLLKIHFPGCAALRYRLQTFRHIDYNGRDLATETLLFAFGLAAIDLSTEVDLCNRYKGICRSAILNPRSLSILQLNRDQDRDLWRLCAL